MSAMGSHTTTHARPDEKMGEQKSKRVPRKPWTTHKTAPVVPAPSSAQRAVMKRHAAKKRRQRDRIGGRS